jgi:phosphopantothenoylcysteine synthetase/decarboxylase
MKAKKCDMMVVNSTKASLESDTTSVRILFPDAKDKTFAACGKQEAAAEIMRIIGERIKRL